MRLRNGVAFTDGTDTAKTPEQLQGIFAKHGANEVYARIATTQKYRSGLGDHSMDRGLDRARLAKALNLPLNPELGLFNVYGDVQCQPPPDFIDYPEIKVPAAWTSLTLEQMLPALRAYGAIAARQILSTGVTGADLGYWQRSGLWNGRRGCPAAARRLRRYRRRSWLVPGAGCRRSCHRADVGSRFDENA